VSIDRLPPQSIEAEQSVLGAILIDRDAVIEVAEVLRPSDFYRGNHGTIYAAVLDLYERREPVDIVTVSETLATPIFTFTGSVSAIFRLTVCLMVAKPWSSNVTV